MGNINDLELAALRTATGANGSINDLRQLFFRTQLNRNDLSVNDAEKFYVGQGFSQSDYSDLWKKFMLSQGVPSTLTNINDMWKYFYENIGFNVVENFIKSLEGLVAYYPMSESSGSTCTNAAPDTVGSLNGTISNVSIGQAGYRGRAYLFDGLTGVVVVADNNLLDFTGSYSVVVLVKLNSYGEGGTGRIIDKQNGVTTAGYMLFTSNSTNRLTLQNVGASANSNNSLSLSEFQVLGVSYDGTNARFYRNGVAIGTPAFTTNPTANTTDLRIGNRGADDRTFSGLMQHLCLFSRALTAEEHLEIAETMGLG